MILRHLLRLITSPLRAKRLEKENAELKEELQAALDLALNDAVTGAMNRHALNIELKKLGGSAQARRGPYARRDHREECSMAILALDLSGFKKVNDEFGHAVGDEALAAVTKAIRRSIRATDHLVFRVGGDEFVVVLEDVNCAEAAVVAKRIITHIEAIPVWELTGRIGGAVWDVNAHPSTSPIDVYAFADTLERELRTQSRNGTVNVQPYEP